MNTRTDIQYLLPAWDAFHSATDIAPIRNEKHYKKLVAMLEARVEAGRFGRDWQPGRGV